ncbi:MAG: Rrf2 family transcriptional regulator [Bacteroidales bacterium]|nr:Rrf2 family transcriptional regulator [Bacteroidales bacterium]MCF8343955.1 Rrf2 family transcriptional regulator [Bacteroidales bacterium]MCF8351193.1 Rrf2 family transcriptional regulator [Bacteroidales bacterium]MCF8375322.1 Rrf2 family transcriptional regulator [Bacteroidales bacterium]MCF8400178.1 Rrf2 family transcriptional regulator [Bacteroidales bacterium]
MTGFGTISEAAYLAIYSMILFVRSGRSLNTVEVANKLFASRHHVMKILQLLHQNKYLGSTRGPKGGYFLKEGAAKTSLLEVYELVSGEILTGDCALNRDACPFARCMFDERINELKMKFKNHLKNKTFDEYAGNE